MLMEEECVEAPSYVHIDSNDFSYRKHKRQTEEDIAVCECQYDILDPESPCGDRCLNLLTNTECTPGYCRCGVYCKNQALPGQATNCGPRCPKNQMLGGLPGPGSLFKPPPKQRFQKCQYARTRLVRTEGRGWGLVADENIMAGQFVIEYCGEVISWKESKRRAQAYETQGLKDAYIIYLNADESIDATRKGNLARFINHSCQPNCETRKWNVLGEVRVGIFAKQDIPFGTELSYDYNFEWYGGVMVRCLCGAASCSGFLGAKSRGFQEATYLWEDDDDRFSVENIPLYDSADDEPTSINKDILLSSHGMVTQYSNISTVQRTENPGNAGTNEFAPIIVDELTTSSNGLAPMNVEPLTASSNEFTPMTIEPLNSMPMVAHLVENGSTEYSVQDTHDASQNSVPKAANHANQTGSQNSSNHSALVPVKPAPKRRGRKPKRVLHKQLDIPDICDRLTSSVACEEILYCEEVKNQAVSEIDAMYDEIRPAVEEHERDSQDSVSTSLAEKWIEASCCKYKAEFDLYAAIIKNVASTPLRSKDDVAPREQNGLKYLENGS